MAARAPPVQIQPWPKMDSAWSRLHVDFAGPLNGSYYIIVVDSYSKWPEVCKCSRPTTSVTFDFLEELFSRYEVPYTIVSDNGTQFRVKEFKRFFTLHSIPPASGDRPGRFSHQSIEDLLDLVNSVNGDQ
ncbi:uncharacterized protein K02A2.6-like [Octopus bimaculoides]|uniref:uncharacterized protein K02A2.6-like n=1 Tax=Octopus bimaculoides TaxID=37653 RepID=UPI00071D9625|nr:uncharacterized protein K02A2.6-like [Octopus bimaculoides]|eukprot:XP_014778463.1 PREDICTED: uncharacterized protein K02A2.6-like [Octopus bimaculoides]